VGPLGRSVEPSEGKGGESVVAISRFSMWYPPPVSVKDRGVGTHEKVLNIRSHVGDIGPINLVACCRQMFGLSALLQWLCWERN
jgi:hypothetical protein